MQNGYQLIFSSCPNLAIAEKIAYELVTNHLAACVNIVPQASSIYLWQGKVEKAEECLLLIKSQQQQFQKLESAIKKIHPYEVPEIIAVPIQQGSAAYLNWLASTIID